MPGTDRSICPICGTTLVSERKQFRSDDEPATLVVGCPVHGSAAELVLRTISSHDKPVRETRSVRSLLIPQRLDAQYMEFPDVSAPNSLYAKRMCIVGHLNIAMTTVHYSTHSVRANGPHVTSSWRLFMGNPIWSDSANDVACRFDKQHMDIASEESYYVLRQELGTRDVDDDGVISTLKYHTVYDTATGAKVVICSGALKDHYTVWLQCDGNNLCPDMLFDRTIERIFTVGVLKGMSVIPVPHSIEHIRSIRHQRDLNTRCTMYITSDMLSDNARGQFVNAKGNYGHIYVYGRRKYLIDLKHCQLRHISYTNEQPLTARPIVMNGYLARHDRQFQVLSCADLYSHTVIPKWDLDKVVEMDRSISYTQVGDGHNWRSFIPDGQHVVRLVKHKHSTVRDVGLYVYQTLLFCCINTIMSDSSCDILYVVGTPNVQTCVLSNKYRVCWIYDHEWDDPLIGEFVMYQDVNEAHSKCSKIHNNVCTTSNWMQQIRQIECVLCILDPLASYDSIRDQRVIISLTADARDKFVSTKRRKLQYLDISSGVIQSINHSLNTQYMDTIGLGVSTDVLPYIAIGFGTLL